MCSTSNRFEVGSFGPTSFPSWVKDDDDRFQRQALIAHNIADAFQVVDTVMLQAPTGAGKTLIAQMVDRLLGVPSIYCCTTKALQDQFTKDFPLGRVLKGRGNYLTDSGVLDEFGNPSSRLRYSAITCADCTFDPDSGDCRWCLTRSLCPYVVARTRAMQAPLAVLNTSYLLTDIGKGSGNFSGRGFLTIDEVDELPREILNHVEVVIPKYLMRELCINPPARKTVEASWVAWVEDAIEQVTTWLGGNSIDKAGSADEIKLHGKVTDLFGRLLMLREELPKGGWIYDGYNGDEVNSIIFRPVHVGRYGERVLWPHADKKLLMSATILSPTLMADDLGITDAWEFIDVPSTFPVENRPIYVVPVANMSYTNRDEAWPEMVKGVESAINLHPDDRVLVHTVSYDLARYLSTNLDLHNRPMFTYTNSGEKDWALKQYQRTHAAVLLAASMDRGTDLPDDLCRVQIVAKIPFLNLKDKQISARLYGRGGSAWYKMQAIRTLIQMCGRGMRHEDDHCTTYVLDAQFGDNLWQSKEMFPMWWKDALTWKMNRRMLLG